MKEIKSDMVKEFIYKKETTMQDFIETILGCIDSHIEDYKKSYEDSDLLF